MIGIFFEAIMFGFLKPKWNTVLPSHLLYLASNPDLKQKLDSFKKRNNLSDEEFCGVILNTRAAMIASIKSNWDQITINEPNNDDKFYAVKTLEDRAVKTMIAIMAAKDSGSMTANKLEVSTYLNDNIETLINTCDSQKAVIDIFTHIWEKSDNSPLAWSLIHGVDKIIDGS